MQKGQRGKASERQREDAKGRRKKADGRSGNTRGTKRDGRIFSIRNL
jgi:hypothetical protein